MASLTEWSTSYRRGKGGVGGVGLPRTPEKAKMVKKHVCRFFPSKPRFYEVVLLLVARR